MCAPLHPYILLEWVVAMVFGTKDGRDLLRVARVLV